MRVFRGHFQPDDITLAGIGTGLLDDEIFYAFARKTFVEGVLIGALWSGCHRASCAPYAAAEVVNTDKKSSCP